jgi:hypothetical protein
VQAAKDIRLSEAAVIIRCFLMILSIVMGKTWREKRQECGLIFSKTLKYFQAPDRRAGFQTALQPSFS